jgi:hypothetical protein
MKIYLDTCCFNRPYDDQNQVKIELETIAKLNIQKEILEKKYDLVWSYILNYENSANPFNDRKENIDKWGEIAKKYVPYCEDVLAKGKEIELLGIGQKDALHLACAIIENCDYFITCDDGILNKNINEIETINPIDFAKMELK